MNFPVLALYPVFVMSVNPSESGLNTSSPYRHRHETRPLLYDTTVTLKTYVSFLDVVNFPVLVLYPFPAFVMT